MSLAVPRISSLICGQRATAAGTSRFIAWLLMNPVNSTANKLLVPLVEARESDLLASRCGWWIRCPSGATARAGRRAGTPLAGVGGTLLAVWGKRETRPPPRLDDRQPPGRTAGVAAPQMPLHPAPCKASASAAGEDRCAHRRVCVIPLNPRPHRKPLIDVYQPIQK